MHAATSPTSNGPPSGQSRSMLFFAPAIAALVLAAGLIPIGCTPNTTKGSTADTAQSPKGDPKTDKPASILAPPGVAINHEEWSKIGYRLDWVGYPFPATRKRASIIAMTASNDALLIQERSSTVTLMETSNGANRWTLDVASPLTKFVGLDRDPTDPAKVLVVSESEIFTLAAATGNLIGRDDLDKVVNSSPVISGDLAIFGTADGQIYAHRRSLGFGSWGFSFDATVESKPVRIGENAFGFVNQRGDVAFLSSQGSLLGRGKIFAGLATNPVADDERMYIAGLDQSVWAFTPTGQLAWRYRTPTPLDVQPAVHDGVLYCEIPASGLTAFDAATGQIKWLAKGTSGTVIGIRKGLLLLWNAQPRGSSTLITIDPRDGSVVDQLSIPDVQRLITDRFVDGAIYIASNKGAVARLVPR